MPTAIRPLELADLDAFRVHRGHALTASPHSYATTAAAWRAASLETVRRLVAHCAAPENDDVIFGSFDDDDGELVGTLGVQRGGKGNVRHKATLWGLFVSPAQRRRGVGRALLRAAIAWGDACSGVHHLRLVVTATDAPARALFESEGFVQYGLEPASLEVEDERFDQVYLLRLTDSFYGGVPNRR